uniref:Uncharacterized protein n=1 Tax=Arundo donax TaxID=35708 RepID=A0A0A9A2R9_ARUDO
MHTTWERQKHQESSPMVDVNSISFRASRGASCDLLGRRFTAFQILGRRLVGRGRRRRVKVDVRRPPYSGADLLLCV